MTIEQKKQALRNALAETWDKMFRPFGWEASKGSRLSANTITKRKSISQ